MGNAPKKAGLSPKVPIFISPIPYADLRASMEIESAYEVQGFVSIDLSLTTLITTTLR